MCFVTFCWDPHFWRKYPHLQVFKDWLFSRKDYYHSTWLEIPNAGWEGDSRTFFCWYVFSGLVHVNSQLERFASLSSGVHICLFSLVSIHSTAADLGLPPSSLLFSVAIMPGPSVLTQGRQKPVCQASTWKSRTLGTCSNLLFPLRGKPLSCSSLCCTPRLLEQQQATLLPFVLSGLQAARIFLVQAA